MGLGVTELSTSTFRTTRAADGVCGKLAEKLGWKHRYVAARIAIARSLSLQDPPGELRDSEADDMATPLRGTQLFGEGAEGAAWLALITQHCGDPSMTKQIFQGWVTRHWARGAQLLDQDWIAAGKTMESFVSRLAEHASFSGSGAGASVSPVKAAPTFAVEARIPIGEAAEDVKSGERVSFALNIAGGSPHMAIMGGVGSGKTRTAVYMLKELGRQCNVPLLAFDFKGDLAEQLADKFSADVVSPPDTPVPLDVLHVEDTDDTSLKTSAARIRDSIASIKLRRPGGVQSEALREAVYAALRVATKGKKAELSDVAAALGSEYADRGRKPDELTATLNELTQFRLFEPNHTPAEFFARSWIVQLPQDGSAEMRRLIINLTLDALDRWINSQPDAPNDEKGLRALRHVTMLDEAHVILSTRLPALGNLVRMSRSKGGAVMLISQSPDDFESAEDGYLDNMGLTLAFNTQARPGPTKRIFGENGALASLQVGEAICRVRSEARTRKIISWSSG